MQSELLDYKVVSLLKQFNQWICGATAVSKTGIHIYEYKHNYSKEMTLKISGPRWMACDI